MCMLLACLSLKILWSAVLPNVFWQKMLRYVQRLLLPATHRSPLPETNGPWNNGQNRACTYWKCNTFLILPMSWTGDLLTHEQKFHPNDRFARGVTTGWRFDATATFTLVVLSLPKQKNLSCAASQLSQHKCTESVTRAQLMSSNLLFHNSLLICLIPQWGQFHLPVFWFPP